MSRLPPEAYRAPRSSARAELREKGSRFLALVVPVADETAAKAELDRIAELHPDASHHCWAWRLGFEARERSSDAGEPAGTAGLPILRVLQGAGLADVLAVVVRWFGGTKLGRGGLVRAYSKATGLALEELVVATRVPATALSVEVGYPVVGALKRLVRPPEIELVEESYGEKVGVVLRVARHRVAETREALADLGLRCEEAPTSPLRVES